MVKKASWVLLSLALFVCVVQIFCARAEDKKPSSVSKTRAVDAVVLLDSSGSMRLTDPNRLRDEGVKLFLQALSSQDKVGILEFSESAREVHPFSKVEPSKTEEISNSLKKIENAGLFTDILSGVKAAKEIFDHNPVEEGRRRVIILFSDGKMDPDPKIGNALGLTGELLNAVVPELIKRHVRVYTIALGDGADKALLNKVASATMGMSWVVDSPDKIKDAFIDLTQIVKEDSFTSTTITKTFLIDEDVEEATFYIDKASARSPVSLIDPYGDPVDPSLSNEKVRWYHGDTSDFVTFLEPSNGNWQIDGLPEGDGFAAVMTDLRLVTEWPGIIYSGSPELLYARLFEGQRPIALDALHQLSDFTLEIAPTDKIAEPVLREHLVDTGELGDKIANDGVFSYQVTLTEPGDYKLKQKVKGPTFERTQIIPFRVRPPLMNFKLITASDYAAEAELVENKSDKEEIGSKAGDAKRPIPGDTFRIDLSSEATALKNVKVKLVGTDDSNYEFVVPLKRVKKLRFEAQAAALPHEGKYNLRAFFSAKGKKDRIITLDSEPIEFEKTAATGPVQVEIPHEEPVAKGFEPPWIGLLLITLINGFLTYYFLNVLKKSQVAFSFGAPEYQSAEGLISAIELVRAKISVKDVDINDPIFASSDESIGTAEYVSTEGSVNEQEAGEKADEGDAQQSSEGATTQEGTAEEVAGAGAGEEGKADSEVSEEEEEEEEEEN